MMKANHFDQPAFCGSKLQNFHFYPYFADFCLWVIDAINLRRFISAKPAKKKATPLGVAFLFDLGFEGFEQIKCNSPVHLCLAAGWTAATP